MLLRCTVSFDTATNTHRNAGQLIFNIKEFYMSHAKILGFVTITSLRIYGLLDFSDIADFVLSKATPLCLRYL
jgi:hypothetical protein